MQIETKKRLTLLVLFTAVVATAFYVINSQNDPALESAPQQASESAEPLPVSRSARGPEPKEIGKVDSNTATSRRVKKERDQEISTTESKEPKVIGSVRDADWENPTVAQSVLESALSGNADAAIEISELFRKCKSGFDNENQVKQALHKMAKRAAGGRPIPSTFVRGSGEAIKFEDLAHYEDFIWNQYAECSSSSGMFNQDLRERLVIMAENGSAVARYLYAQWPPNREKTESDRLIAWLVYQNRALEFTWDNINEGEPLGLLAYGQSLDATQSAFFTPRNTSYGQAFILASDKCGMNNPMVSEKVSYLSDFWKQRQMTQHSVRVETLSEEITDMFCR
jgi:hypothetical protein